MSKYLSLPKLSPALIESNHRKLTDEQIQLGKELLKDSSERWVASQLGVSRHTMRIHCKPGYREWWYENHKKKWRQDPDIKKAAARRRYATLKAVNPDAMKAYSKQHYEEVKSNLGMGYIAASVRKSRAKSVSRPNQPKQGDK